MRSRRAHGRAALVAIVALSFAAAWPSVDALVGSSVRLDAPLDASLRVPFGAAYLRDTSPAFEQHDRVLGVSLPSEGALVTPRDRAELYEGLAKIEPAGPVSLQVARDRKEVAVPAVLLKDPGWRRVARNWPTLFLGLAFLAFALVIAGGSRHPVAMPLFAVSWCVGTSTLCKLDLLFPEDPGILGLGLLRGRLEVLSLVLLPASILHLAMRFPVVAPRFRRAGVAAVPYVFWLFPAVFAQLRLENAAFLNALETIALGATFLASGILVLASVTHARAMTPIERSRTRALLVGLGVGSAAPFVYFVTGSSPPPEYQSPLSLSLLAFPAAICWAIVRFRLLDPPVWLQRVVLTGLTGGVSILLAIAAVSLTLSLLDEPGSLVAAEAVPVAIATTVFYELIQLGLRRGAIGRMLREGMFERLLESASRELASARAPRLVLERLGRLIATHLGASRVEHLDADGDPAGETPLTRRGLELWLAEGSPPHRIVRARAREEDPGADVPEIVLPLTPESRPAALVVVASRADGLPYTDEQERMLSSLVHVGTTALAAAATTADLERKVTEKTASLERGLQDRQAVLGAARAICEAAAPQEVFGALEAFASAEGAQLRWDPEQPSPHDAIRAELEVPGGGTRSLVLDGLESGRCAELTPQIRTLCVFAGLAIARLDLLAELKREVERQAAELADLTSRRLHAEFVRGVAHELRKPAEEVRRHADALLAGDGTGAAEITRRLHSATREMSRRLDLLLFHSGLRLDRRRIDLVPIVADAVEAARAAVPERDYGVRHEFPRLPMVGDPSRLQSVLENLLDNAVKATAPGQAITVTTSIEAGTRKGPMVRLEVEDEGRGIDRAKIDEIFEPGVAFAPSGFGLGLSLCREIVRMHGGRIGVESRPGRTVFHVRIPQFPRSLGEAPDDGIDPAG